MAFFSGQLKIAFSRLFMASSLAGIITLASTPAGARPCDTHEMCHFDMAVECTCPARSADWVYYYLDIAVAKNATYRCEFDADALGKTGLVVWPHLAKTPAGVYLQWTSCSHPDNNPPKCLFESAVLTVQASAMQADEGVVIVKYGRVPSDYPFSLRVVCSQVS